MSMLLLVLLTKIVPFLAVFKIRHVKVFSHGDRRLKTNQLINGLFNASVI